MTLEEVKKLPLRRGTKEHNRLIWKGLLLELTALTLWKIFSSLSADIKIYACLELLLAFAGICRMANGLRKSTLEEDTTSKYCHQSMLTWIILLAFFMSLFHLYYFKKNRFTRINWWGEYVAMGDNYDIGLTFFFVIILVIGWYMFVELLRRLWLTAEVKGMTEAKNLVVRLRWWSHCTMLFSAVLYVFFFVTGDSRSTPLENGILSGIYLSLHWGLGIAVCTLLHKMKKTDMGAGGEKAARKPKERRDKALAGVLGTVVLALCATALVRYSSAEDFQYFYSNDGKIILDNYIGDRARVRIPEEIDGVQVIALSGTFYHNKKLRKIWLPEGIQSLGRVTFAFCDSLEEIDLPASLNTIGNMCFYGSGVTAVHLKEDNLQSVGYNVFDSTPWQEQSIQETPDGFLMLGKTLIGYYPGDGIQDVLYVPDKVEMIADGGFVNVEQQEIILRELYLPSGLRELGRYTLKGVAGLKDIHIPEKTQFTDGYQLRGVSEDTVVWGKKGSEAERMALQMEVLFAEEGQPRPMPRHFR